MAAKRVSGALLILLILASAASAATCAENAYMHMCAACSFDANGKVEESCWQAQQARGVACFSTSYPKEFTLYSLGMCPAVDKCLQRLDRCRLYVGLANDQQDCKEDRMQDCFETADECAAAAAKDCQSDPPDTGLADETKGLCESFLWAFVLVPAACPFYRRE